MSILYERKKKTKTEKKRMNPFIEDPIFYSNADKKGATEGGLSIYLECIYINGSATAG
jgi:hypothetical protein